VSKFRLTQGLPSLEQVKLGVRTMAIQSVASSAADHVTIEQAPPQVRPNYGLAAAVADRLRLARISRREGPGNSSGAAPITSTRSELGLLFLQVEGYCTPRTRL